MSDPAETPDWRGPGSGFHTRMSRLAKFKRGLLAGRYERSRITQSGILFVCITLALGTAAYNAGNNLLFLALSLLLTCLLFNGVLAWVNFGGAAWRLQVPTRMRAGETSTCAVEVANARDWTPLCALYFVVKFGSEKSEREVRMREAVEPGKTARLPWTVTPASRGRARVDLAFVGSLFPFGFLRKAVIGEVAHETLIHPPRVRYTSLGAALSINDPGHRSSQMPGEGSDLLSIREYRQGDAPRSIHWKATARTGELMVRDLARDTDGQCELLLDFSALTWPQPEQFESFIAFAASLLEDLYSAGRLRAVRIGSARAIPVRRPSDVTGLLDLLSEAQRGPQDPAPIPTQSRAVVTFHPEPDSSINAMLHGRPFAHYRPE